MGWKVTLILLFYCFVAGDAQRSYKAQLRRLASSSTTTTATTVILDLNYTVSTVTNPAENESPIANR